MKLFNTAKFEEELEDLAEKGYAQVAVREFIYVRVAFDFAENEAAMETDKVKLKTWKKTKLKILKRKVDYWFSLFKIN